MSSPMTSFWKYSGYELKSFLTTLVSTSFPSESHITSSHPRSLYAKKASRSSASPSMISLDAHGGGKTLSGCWVDIVRGILRSFKLPGSDPTSEPEGRLTNRASKVRLRTLPLPSVVHVPERLVELALRAGQPSLRRSHSYLEHVLLQALHNGFGHL